MIAVAFAPDRDAPPVSAAANTPPAPANPYLDEVRPHVRVGRGGMSLARMDLGYAARQDATRRYAWAVPNEAALAAIAALGPIVEIGAGTGYWTSLLRARGVDVVAYDVRPPVPTERRNGYHLRAGTWTEVRRGREQAVRRHGDRALFLCWPPYASRMAWRTLYLYQGARLAYVGEDAGGCTGDDRFHDRLERDWELVDEIAIPQWPGVHDALFLYTRRGAR